ncbi:MAG: hypothetical protein JWQ74_1394 [Marmoricola sp.]|nr:hypothetical protein [Marmoricola sp.]
MDADVLEPAVEKAYARALPGSTLSSVSCPDGASAARGSKISCTITTSGGARGQVRVTYTGTDGTRYAFAITQVPSDLSSATIQRRIRAEFATVKPDEVITKLDCPGDFDLGKAVFTDCRLDLADGDQYIATVSRTDAGKLQIDFAAI